MSVGGAGPDTGVAPPPGLVPVGSDELAARERAAPQPVRPGAIRVGHVLGVPVRVNPIAVLLALVVGAGTLGPIIDDAGGSEGTLWGLGGGLLLEVCIFAHELAHAAVARRLGLQVGSLQLVPLGGSTMVEPSRTATEEYAVAAAGPLVSLVLAGVLALAARLVDGGAHPLLPFPALGSAPGLLLAWLAALNALLAAFNLLPCLPLDGGRVLRAAAWGVTGRATAGAWTEAVVSLALGCGGLVASLQIGPVLSLPLAVFSAFVLFLSRVRLRDVRVRERAARLSLRAIVRRALPVPAETPLAEALRRASAAGATAVVSLGRDGVPAALMSGARVDAMPVTRRPWVPLAEVSRPLAEGLVLDAALPGDAVLRALRAYPASEYLIVEAGRVLGVLATVDVVARISGRTAPARA